MFATCVVPERKLNNEITVLASKSVRSPETPQQTAATAQKIDLTRVLRVVDFLIHSSEQMAVFGVAPTGTFCGALLGERLECFVDEDTNIQFKHHLGKMILPPDQLELAVRVFLPLNKNSEMIKSRLNHLRFVTEEDF
jgi:hypothetical protein